MASHGAVFQYQAYTMSEIHKSMLTANTYVAALLAGIATGAAGIGASALIAKFNLGTEPLAGDKLFQTSPLWWIVTITIAWGPIFETIVAQTIPVFIVRRFTDQPIIWAVVSAAVFAIGHYLGGGGRLQIAMTFIYGLVFATAYVLWLPSGQLRAASSVALMHAANNAFILAFSLGLSSNR